MTVYQSLARRKLLVIAVSLATAVLGVFAGLWMLRHADPRWGQAEVYGALGVTVFVVARLVNSRLLRCPRCALPLYQQMDKILLKEVSSCPQCGLNFTDRYP